MKSSYVFKEEAPSQNLGFLPAIPALASTAAGGAQATPGVVDSVKSIASSLGIGKKKEKGSGITQRGTVAHAIDKYEKANDIEAERIAPKAIQMKVNGASDVEIANYIAGELGYPQDGGVANSHKWSYVSQTLNQAASKVQAQQQSSSNVMQNATKSGISPWLIGGGVLLVGGTVAALAK